MTAALIVSCHSKQVDKAIIDKDYFVIGRSRRCDLTLDDKNVSREHTIILRKPDGHYIQDRGSRNGTAINDAPVTSQTRLKEGDRIQIGPYELRFMESEAVAAQADDEPKTQFAGVPESAKSKKAAGRKRAASANLRYKLVATDGPLRGTSFADWEGDLTFGRGADNNVVLPDDGVSTRHARILQDDGLFFIEDLGSSNGTFVQGVRIQKMRLKGRARIRLGGSTFTFTAIDPEKRKFMIAVTSLSMLFLFILTAVVVLMTPKDELAVFAHQGYRQLEKGDFVAAKKSYEQVLEARPGDAAARKYLSIAKQGLAREERYVEAEQAAANEQFQTALDACYELMRDYPKFKKADDLAAVIKRIQDAKLAFDSKNWPDAIRLLKRAREAYPNSALLARLLERAQTEQAAQESLATAKRFLEHGQEAEAVEHLRTIPQDSVHFAEAGGMLRRLEMADALADTVDAAQAAYEKGNIAESRAMIVRGLEQDSGNPKLRTLSRHLDEVAPLIEEIERGRLLMDSEDIVAIRRALGMCEDLVRKEPDQSNEYHRRAGKLNRNLQLRLGELEREAMTMANALLAEGNKREAHKYLALAAQANPENREASGTLISIRSEVAAECKKYFQEGLVHEELGQIEAAVAAYQKVIEAALVDDSYYVRAQSKLQHLPH